jgi:hypothetical protein
MGEGDASTRADDRRAGARQGVRLPWVVFALLVAGFVLLFGQGLRMARDRHARLLPARTPAVLRLSPDPAREISVRLAPGDRFLALELGDQADARLGLVQVLPQRTLVRWIEPGDTPPGGLLIVPLEGLEPGHYVLTREKETARAGPREMDEPVESLDVLTRFRLEPPIP